jgi:hypothetical protein
MYRTNYANPNCKNKEELDCSYGQCVSGYCSNCLSKVSLPSKKKKSALWYIIKQVLIGMFAFWALLVLMLVALYLWALLG